MNAFALITKELWSEIVDLSNKDKVLYLNFLQSLKHQNNDKNEDKTKKTPK